MQGGRVTTRYMTKSPTSIQSTVVEACGNLPEVTLRTVMVVAADYLVMRDARVLRKRLRTAMPEVANGTRENIVDSIASMLQYRSSAKRVWKAVWETLQGGTTAMAARLYDVSAEDVDLVLEHMSETTLDYLTAIQRTEVRSNVAVAEVQSLTQELGKHVRRVGRRLRFITAYDPAIDAEDIKQDLMVKALKTVYDYENMTPWDGVSQHTALLNKARAAASSGVFDAIKYYSNPVRSRVVGMYTCDECACTSEKAAPTCTWCGASMVRAKRLPHVTTCMIHWTNRVSRRRACGLDGEADKRPSDQYVDLAEDLMQHLDDTTRTYLCCLLRESSDFDTWLQETYADTSDELSDSKIRKLAAAYVGEPRKKLDQKLMQAAKKARIR